MTICRLLTGVMGGEIKVDSTPGIGSRFQLRLFLPPVLDRQQIVRRAPIVEAFGTGKTVLLADDDAAHRIMVSDALAPYGFAITGVADGLSALELAKAIQPDLYLLDIDMPGLDGWQLAEAIRGTEARSSKILILSASAMEEHRMALAATLHDAFIMKPVDIDLLLETIAGLVELKTPEQSVDHAPPAARPDEARPGDDLLEALLQEAEIGYIRGLRDRLAQIRDPALAPFATRMLRLVENMDMAALIAALPRLREPAG